MYQHIYACQPNSPHVVHSLCIVAGGTVCCYLIHLIKGVSLWPHMHKPATSSLVLHFG